MSVKEVNVDLRRDIMKAITRDEGSGQRVADYVLTERGIQDLSVDGSRLINQIQKEAAAMIENGEIKAVQKGKHPDWYVDLLKLSGEGNA